MSDAESEYLQSLEAECLMECRMEAPVAVTDDDDDFLVVVLEGF